jgi:hypothetical protein
MLVELQEKTEGFWTSSKKYIITLLIGMFIGAFGFYSIYTPEPQVINIPSEPIVLKGDTETDIVYVEKEPGEKTDVELNTKPLDIIVKTNGQTHVIENKVNETQKFENGKLVIDQKSELDITKMVDELARVKAELAMKEVKKQIVNNEIKAGITVFDGEVSGSAGYEAKNNIEVIAHVNQKGIVGGTVMKTVAKW